MSRALAFMADPALAASVLPAAGGGLDIPAFLRAHGTLYLIADSQEGSGTGQIWVTSSRPIKSGGSSRADGDAWPV